MTLKILGIIAFVLAGLLCLGAIVFGIPGNWIILLIAVIIAAVGGFQKISLGVLLLLLGLSLLAELLEFLIGYFGARIKGASRWASLSAIVFSIIGALLMVGLPPVLGPLIGAFLGAFLGAFAVELWTRKKLQDAYQAGLAAMIGRIGAMVSKVAVAVTMVVIVVYYLL